jgi:hypothetical protein
MLETMVLVLWTSLAVTFVVACAVVAVVIALRTGGLHGAATHPIQEQRRATEHTAAPGRAKRAFVEGLGRRL